LVTPSGSGVLLDPDIERRLRECLTSTMSFSVQMAQYNRNMDPERKQRIETFLAEVKAEAQKIDAERPRSFGIGRRSATRMAFTLGRPSLQVGREYFARNPGSDVSVHFEDLPPRRR
jgi:hypothetical protein